MLISLDCEQSGEAETCTIEQRYKIELIKCSKSLKIAKKVQHTIS